LNSGFLTPWYVQTDNYVWRIRLSACSVWELTITCRLNLVFSASWPYPPILISRSHHWTRNTCQQLSTWSYSSRVTSNHYGTNDCMCIKPCHWIEIFSLLLSMKVAHFQLPFGTKYFFINKINCLVLSTYCQY
jgi:hypothetical protein